MRRSSVAASAFLLLTLFAVSHTSAHDLAGIDMERKGKELNAKKLGDVLLMPAPPPSNLLQMRVLEDKRQAIAILGGAKDPSSLTYALNKRLPGIESVFDDHLGWLPETTLKVCFSTPGNDSIKRLIVDVAQEWTRYANIKFSFGASPKYASCKTGDGNKIRISLEATGNSSLVGTEANGHDLTNTDTMFYSRDDVGFGDTPRFRWLVLHEFGHALGLQHEHQHPAKNCIQQLKVEKISASFGWDSEDVAKNLARIEISSAAQSARYFATGTTATGTSITYSEYDSESVMHYDIDASYFNTDPPGNCWVEAVRAHPSTNDQRAVARAYPVGKAKDYVRSYNGLIERAIRETSSLTSLQKQALRTLKKAQ